MKPRSACDFKRWPRNIAVSLLEKAMKRSSQNVPSYPILKVKLSP